MTCPVCGYRNLDSRATCRRCGAPLHGPADKTLGPDEPDDTGLIVDLDEADIAPRAPARPVEAPAPAAPAAPPRPVSDPGAEALRARALTAGDRDPRHAPPRGPEAARQPEAPPPAVAPPPVAPPPVAPPPVAPPPRAPEAPPARPAVATDTVAGMRRTPPRAEPSVAPAAPGTLAYAGFWIRLLAMVVDWTLILAVLLFTSAAAMLVLGGPGAAIDPAGAAAGLGELRAYFALFELVLLAVYFTFFTWAAGGSPGKLVLRLKVVQVDGRPVTGGRAFLRFLGYGLELVPGIAIAGVVWTLVAVGTLLLQQRLLSVVLGTLATFLVFVGYFWAAFDLRKQAWHDKLAGTVVVRTG